MRAVTNFFVIFNKFEGALKKRDVIDFMKIF